MRRYYRLIITALSITLKVIASLFLALILSMLLVIIVSLGNAAINEPQKLLGIEKKEKW